MITPELENYIKQSLTRGVSEQEIRTALRSAGWQESDIKEGFNKIKPSSFQFSPLSPQSGIKISNVKGSQTVVKKPKRFGKVILISAIIIALAAGGYLFYKYFESQRQPSNEAINPISSSASTSTEVSTTTSTSTIEENQLSVSTTVDSIEFRDWTRTQNLSAVQTAVELYYSVEKKYPAATNWADLEKLLVNTINANTDLTHSQIFKLPNDPLYPTQTYFYAVSSDKQNYVLKAMLENKNNAVLQRPDTRDVDGIKYDLDCNDPAYCIGHFSGF